MFPELSEIKSIRKRLELTQFQLAKKAGISQSLIAKIEAGKIDPTYAKARKLFDTLRELSHSKKVKAKDIMHKKVIFAKPKELINDVIKDMRKHGISQLPVIDKNELVGFISETIILEALIDGNKKYIDQIMSERPPSVSQETTIDVVSGLLRYFPMVAVYGKELMVGIITKSDVLKNLL